MAPEEETEIVAGKRPVAVVGGNLFRTMPPPSGSEETLELLAAGRGFRIERIVSAGQVTPPGAWYDQTGDEWVALLQGRAALRYEDGRLTELSPGDWLWIPARVRHRVEAMSAEPPCIWLAVHLEPSSLTTCGGGSSSGMSPDSGEKEGKS